MIWLCMLGRTKYILQNWAWIQSLLSESQVLNFCSCRGLSVTTENHYVDRTTCSWSLYSQLLFYAHFFTHLFAWLPVASVYHFLICAVIFGLTLWLAVCYYTNPLFLIGRTLSLCFIFSHFFLFFFLSLVLFPFSSCLYFSFMLPLPASGGSFMFWGHFISEHP